MAENAERILKILLQLKADTGDVSKVAGGLKEIEAQAVATQEAVSRAGGLPGANAGQVDYKALAAERTAATASVNALDTEGIAIAEKQALAEAAKVLQKERQVLLSTQLEAINERATGNTAAAAALEREVAIRREAIAIQSTLNVSQKEATQLATDYVVAQELIAKAKREQILQSKAIGLAEKEQAAASLALYEEKAVVAKALTTYEREAAATNIGSGLVQNVGKARAEILVLIRELIAGGNATRTIGSLIGTLAPALTVAGLAAYVIYEAISSVGEEIKKLNEEVLKTAQELDKQVAKWIELAARAKDFGDAVKLGEQIASDLESATTKFDELRKREITKWQLFKSELSEVLSGNLLGGSNELLDARDAAIAKERELFTQRLLNNNALRESANVAIQTWERIKTEPFAQGIADITAEIDALKVKQADLLARSQVPDHATDDQLVAAAAAQKQLLDEINPRIELWNKNLGEVGKSQEHITDQAQKLGEEIKKTNLADLDPDERLKVYAADVEHIRAQLRLLGVDAGSPNEAIEKGKNLIAESAREVLDKLVPAWRVLLGEIKKTNDEQEKAAEQAVQEKEKADKEAANEARRKQHEVIAALLREESGLLSDIRAQQQLIAQDPFLSVEARDEQLANLYRQEQIEILKQILKLKAQIALISTAGKEQAEVAKLTQKLHQLGTEYQLLGQKVKALSFGGALRKDLTAWANSFGSAVHQIAGVIEGTLNVAIEKTAQLLTDAIFRTGDWKAALQGVAEAAVQGLIRMLLQFVISRTVMSLLNAAFGKADAQASSSQASQAAASWAPAATSASIASYGAAAGAGTIAYIAALASGQAAAVGMASAGYKQGGFTGFGDPNEIAGPAHKGEFYHSAEQTLSLGIENLSALHRGEASIIPHFKKGGLVSDDGFQIEGEPRWLPGNIGRGPFGGTPTRPWNTGSVTITSDRPPATHGQPTVETPRGGNPSVTIGGGAQPWGNPGVEIGRGGGYQPWGNPAVEIGRGGGYQPWGNPTVEIGRGGAAVPFDSGVPDNDPSRVIVRGSPTDYNANLATPWGFATSNNYAIGETIPTNGQAWSYGGNDAPIGSTVGVTSSGQRIIQGADGQRFVGSPSIAGGVSAAEHLANASANFTLGLANQPGRPNLSQQDQIGYLGNDPTPGGSGWAARAGVINGPWSAANQRNLDYFSHPAGHRAEGGGIFGGSGTQDDIPILAMGGEFMLRKAAVEHYGLSTLEAMNSMRVAAPAAMRFADGGLVGGGRGGSQRPITQKFVIVHNMEAAFEEQRKSRANETHIVQTVQKNRHAIGGR